MVLLGFNLQVRKEKLGDRIAALHRLVAPFGKVYIHIYTPYCIFILQYENSEPTYNIYVYIY